MWSKLTSQELPLGGALRARLFQGECLTLPSPSMLQRGLHALRGNLEEQFDCPWEEMRELHREKTHQSCWEARQFLHQTWMHPSWKKRWKDLFSFLVPAQESFLISRPTLRICMPGGQHQEELKNAYSLHRDTWYGYPASTINVWIPLHDVQADETFELYPSWFDQSLQNSSHLSDWKVWKEKPHLAHYPTAVFPENTKPLTVEGYQDQLFLFSAQHLHRTTPYDHTQTRLSLDLRIILDSDIQEQRGALMRDNRAPPLPRDMLES